MYRFIFVLILHFLVFSGIAQTSSLGQDSARKAAISHLSTFIKGEKEKSTKQFYEDKISLTQELSLETILQFTRTAKEYLKSGIDTTGLQHDLADIKEKYLIAGDGIFTNNNDGIKTHRNLTTTSKILNELLKEVHARELKIDIYKRKLIHYRNNIDSLSSDSSLFVTSGDSVRFVHYLGKLALTAKEVHPVDSMLKQSINSLQKLKDLSDYIEFEIITALDHIEQDEIIISNKSLDKEIPYLWQLPVNARAFDAIIHQSFKKGMLILKYYTSNNIGRIILMFMLLATSILFITSLKNKAQSKNLIRTDFSDQLVIRYPVLSAVLIVVNVFQFIFPDPPFIFNCLLWIISTTSLTFIFMNYITRYWMYFWISMWVLFILACGNNLILQVSGEERWVMLFIASAGIVSGAFILSKRHRGELREKTIVYFIVLIIILEILSIIANIYGRFNFSKSLLTSGFINVIIGISFLWTVRIINEGLALASQMFQTPERRLFYINFGVIGNRAPMFLYVFLVIGWFIVFARNFYEFSFITKPIRDFIYAETNFGQYHFSIYTIVSFLMILIVATVISRIVSFFGTGSTTTSTYNNKKSGIGSWILLIRIFIIVIGLILALAVAGIPLDKATFILGALGVGVGFGLQSLVQNLVSGIVLTIENPVSVGDYVEIKGQTGTIKSIGFRSSVLMTVEGSNVIIPNGELLNENITNWTHGRDVNRRTEIVVGVAYGTDLELAKKILLDLTTTHKSILKIPAPYVLVTEFDSYSINLQVFFWTATPVSGRFIKSELVIDIHTAFKNNNIGIPFLKQDVYVKSASPDSETEH